MTEAPAGLGAHARRPDRAEERAGALPVRGPQRLARRGGRVGLFRIADFGCSSLLGRPLLIVVSFCLVVLDCIANVP